MNCLHHVLEVRSFNKRKENSGNALQDDTQRYTRFHLIVFARNV